MKKINFSRRFGITSGIVALVGTLLLPAIAGAATNTANTTINATVDAVISITSSSPVALSLTPTSGGVVTSASDTVTVNTNNAAGYTLTFADSNSNADLISGSDTFGPHAGTQASPTALANSKWGYAVASLGGFDSSYSVETNNGSSTSKWAGVPVNASPNTLKTTSSTAAKTAQPMARNNFLNCVKCFACTKPPKPPVINWLLQYR